MKKLSKILLAFTLLAFMSCSNNEKDETGEAGENLQEEMQEVKEAAENYGEEK